MIRPTDPNYGSGVGTAGSEGFDKFIDRAMPYVTFNRNIYWWEKVSVKTAIDLKPNTDPGSPIVQRQAIRFKTPVIELESMVPDAANSTAQSYIHDLRSGVLLDTVNIPILDSILASGTTSYYGDYVVEKSTVDWSRDDFTKLRVTIRAVGYGSDTTIADSNESYTAAESPYSPSDIDSQFPA